MADPIEAVSSTIGTAFKLAEFCLALKEVDSESRAFLELIDRVRKDLAEANRERYEKQIVLKSMPSKRAWIDDTIIDTRKTLNDIGTYVENVRVDLEQGKVVRLRHRFEWVLSNHQRFITSELKLSTCHKSLLTAIAAMYNLHPCIAPVQPPVPAYSTTPIFKLKIPDNDKKLLSPGRRRPRREARRSLDGLIAELPFEKDLSSISPISTFSTFSCNFSDGQDTTLQNASYESSLHTLVAHQSLPTLTSPSLPEIQLSAFFADELFCYADRDKSNLSILADAFETKGESCQQFL